MSILIISKFLFSTLYDFVNSLSTKRITHSTCSCIGNRCNWCPRWRWPAPLLRFLPTAENRWRRLRRVESRQCIGTSCAVEWMTTPSLSCSFILSFFTSFFFYLHGRKLRQFYVKIRPGPQRKTQFSVPRLEHPKNILRRCRAPRGERRRLALTNCEINGPLMLCLCVRALEHARASFSACCRARKVSL